MPKFFPARALILSAMLIACSAPVLAATTYTLTPAVQRDPATNAITAALASPKGINKFGQIVGRCGVFNPADNTITTMFTLTASGQNTCNLTPYGINAARQIVGFGFAVSPGISVRNIDGTVISLGVVPGYVGGWSSAISDTGFVAGYNGTGAGGWCDHRAVVGNLATRTLRLLGDIRPAGGWSYPYAVNNNGQVVGHASYAAACVTSQYGGAHAFVSTPNGMTDLHVATGTPNAGSNTSSVAYAINDNGLAVGNYMVSQGAALGTEIYHAVVWNTATNTFLDLGSAGVTSTLYGINKSGQVVGSQANAAVVGNAAGGALIDLNTLVPGKPAGVFFSRAVGINDAGQIAVEAGTSAYLLTPTGVVATPTPAPTNIVATVVTSTKITLSWTDNAANETAQYIQRCYVYNNSCTAKIQVSSNVTSYIDTGFVSGYAYYYRVSAVSASGESTAATSNFANTGPPSMVTAMRITGLARTQATIEWNDNAFDETSYAIDRVVCSATTSTCASKNKISLPANTVRYTATGLTPNTAYTYRVWAVGRFGISGINSITFQTAP